MEEKKLYATADNTGNANENNTNDTNTNTNTDKNATDNAAEQIAQEHCKKILSAARKIEGKIADIEHKLADFGACEGDTLKAKMAKIKADNPDIFNDIPETVQDYKAKLESGRDILKTHLAKLKSDNPDVFTPDQDEDNTTLTPIITTDPSQLISAIVDDGKKNTLATDASQTAEQIYQTQYSANGGDKQSRISEAENFFNLLFGNVTERKFGYLWTKQGDSKATYPFMVSNPDERREMARKAIELSDAGADVYYGINLTDTPPAVNARVTAAHVTLQTATVTDIDVEGGKHISDDKKTYPPTFDTAKSFLPFETSITVSSGYGLHGLCIYAEPIVITAGNRKQAEDRNKKFLDVIRRCAGIYAKAVDGVGDLPRVLRVPGTFNYKCGRDNPPLCKLVDVNTIRFTPTDLDERLNALTPARDKTKQEAPPMKAKVIQLNPVDKPSEQERALAMLRFVPAADQTYEDWIAIGMILKNNNNYLSDWEQWSRPDERFKEGECQYKWQTFDSNGGLTIATLHDFASKLYGYSEKAFQRDWYALHDNSRTLHRKPDAEEITARLAELKTQPQSKSRDAEIISATRELCTWNHKKNDSGQIVKTTIKSVFANMDTIFDYDPNLSGLFGFDNFQGEIIFLKKAIWHDNDKTGEKWRDSDDAELRNYLRKNYAELKERQLIEDYVIHYANRNSFNAVKNFYESLPAWDGTPRAETLFVKFLGAEDNDYTREVTIKWLIGAIARVYHPGCDFQWAPVLQGAQRIGKSKLVKMLGGKEGVNPDGYSWHVALKDSVDDAHAVDAIQKGGIVEIEEFSAARRAEINALKSFISADEDTRRFAYEKRASTRKRHGVFIVTCNDQQFLRDPTGNARFWIIKCTQKKFNRVDGMTTDYIRQVWAEVYQRYNELFKNGFDEAKLKPSLELEIRAEEIAENYLQDDGMTTEIKSFLDKKLPPAIIWRLMNKDDRRKFFVDGQIIFDEATLNFRRRAQGGTPKDIEHDINEIFKLCHSQRTDIREIKIFDKTQYIFYGSELREHICAAEIFNECFGTGDKRKLMYRFNEILDTLDGWHLGARLRTDPEYREQKKPYYRDKDNRPAEEDSQPAEQPDTDFQGKPLEPDELPPIDEDDLPFD